MNNIDDKRGSTMIITSINTIKIYEVNEYKIEDDFHIVTGLFTELSLAQSVKPLKNIELIVIKEMSLHDGQFFLTGYTYSKEREADEYGNQSWSDWKEVFHNQL